MIARQKLQLANEGRIVGAVGEHDDRAQGVEKIGFDHIVSVDRRECDDLFGARRNRKKCRKGQGQDGKERTTGETLHVPDIGAKAQKPKRGKWREWRE